MGFRDKQNHRFYGHGKLLLSGEYLVLDGATALAVPTTIGQSLMVNYRPSFDPFLTWKSFGREKDLWLEATFEFWHFDLVNTKPTDEILFLQKVLRQVRQLNAHFLRDGVHVNVETYLDFPRQWGLGASSTLLHNMAQWACVSPFELLFRTLEGSGYDMACAQAFGPIIYKKTDRGPKWSMVEFNPPFKDQLYFLYLGHKQNSREAIHFYQKCGFAKEEIVKKISSITESMLQAKSLEAFEDLMMEHELILSQVLSLPPVQKQKFPDFQGTIKSLGAWGGDFVLVASDLSFHDLRNYFLSKGYDVLIPFRELIFYAPEEKAEKNDLTLFHDLLKEA